jgi:hypothetical protein
LARITIELKIDEVKISGAKSAPARGTSKEVSSGLPKNVFLAYDGLELELE